MKRRIASLCLAVLVTIWITGDGVASSSQLAKVASGVITGRVVDQSGRPVVWASVYAVQRLKRWNGPYHETASAGEDQTDDRGQFRLHSLEPGTYVVAVSTFPLTTRRKTTPEPPEGTAFARIYNPGTSSLGDAELIAVRAGETRDVSVRLSPTPLFLISGMVTTSSGTAAAGFDVRLDSLAPEVLRGASDARVLPGVPLGTRVAQDGSFALKAPAEEYMLSINNGWQGRGSKQPLETGERRIAVGSTPLTDLRIVTGEGAVVRGRLELEEDPKRQAGGGTLRAVPPPRISISGGYEAAVQPDGTFEFRNVSGLRKIEGLQLPFNWVIKSVEAPPNIRVGEYLDFAPMSAIENLKVIATIGGQLRGTVSGVDSAPNRERNVLLLPALPTARDYRGRDFYGYAQVFSIGDTFRYAMDKILPGSYLVVAVDISVADLTADSNVMEKARAAAVPVDITPGFSNRTLELSMTRLQQYVVAPREIQ